MLRFSLSLIVFLTGMVNGTPDELREGYRKWLDLFAGSRVTEMLFNVNYQMACFDSKVWDRYGDGGRPSHWTGIVADMITKGVDPYKICIGRCREIGIGPWTFVILSSF